MEELGKILSYVVTALVAGVTAFLARKKAKEDANLAIISRAIDTWRDLAESNKTHWDTAEKEVDRLNKDMTQLRIELQESRVLAIELRAQVSLLNLKVERLSNGQ